MFQDRNKALQRLEQALLEEEEADMQPEEADYEEDEELLSEETLDELLEDVAPGKDSIPYQNYSNDYGQAYNAYNTDVTDTDLDEYCEEVLDERTTSYTGLIILACLLAIGIFGTVIYLLLRYGGVL